MILRKRAHLALTFLVAATTHACSGGNEISPPPPPPPPPLPTPAVLSVDLTTPNADDGAVLLTIRGPVVDSVVARPFAATVARSTGAMRVLVYGNIGSGTLARVFIPDAARLAEYGITLDEAASRASFQQQNTTDYRVTLRRE